MPFAKDRRLFQISTGVIGLGAYLLGLINLANASLLDDRKNTLQQIRQFEQQLKQTELTLAKHHQKKRQNTQKIQKIQQEKTILAEEKRKLTAKRRQQRQQLEQWIDWLYRQNLNRTALTSWLSNLSIEQQDRLYQYYDYLHSHYQHQYDEWEATETEWQLLTHQLSLQEASQKELASQMQQLIAKTEQQKTTRQHAIQQLQKTLKELDQKYAQQRAEKQREKALQLTEKKVLPSQQQTKLEPTTAKMIQQKGLLPWPLKGSLRHQFNEQHPDKWRWKGWVINGESGQAIHNIANGKIVFADWLSGYGLLIVIDHGDQLMSLYGYNRLLARTLGETVKQGEILAYVGDTGGQQASALYFELRQKGKPINPKNWLIPR